MRVHEYIHTCVHDIHTHARITNTSVHPCIHISDAYRGCVNKSVSLSARVIYAAFTGRPLTELGGEGGSPVHILPDAGYLITSDLHDEVTNMGYWCAGDLLCYSLYAYTYVDMFACLHVMTWFCIVHSVINRATVIATYIHIR
jgi:hypothetical protein